MMRKQVHGRNPTFIERVILGTLNQKTVYLHVLGHIKGGGMVKTNGIQIELTEIENSIIDDTLANSEECSLVVDCMAATTTTFSMCSDEVEHQQKQLAYCLLSAESIPQLSIPPEQLQRVSLSILGLCSPC